MGRELKYLIYAIILLLVQILVFKEAYVEYGIFRYVHIFIYPLIFSYLPVKYPSSLVVLIGFVMGIILDVFYSSPGVHMGAFVFTAFMRKSILNFMEPRGGYKQDVTPLEVNRGMNWYMVYLALLLFVHMLMYFVLEYFSFKFFWQIWLSTIFSFLVSYLVLMMHFLLYRSISN